MCAGIAGTIIYSELVSGLSLLSLEASSVTCDCGVPLHTALSWQPTVALKHHMTWTTPVLRRLYTASTVYNQLCARHPVH
jgi:hypothetical protein